MANNFLITKTAFTITEKFQIILRALNTVSK